MENLIDGVSAGFPTVNGKSGVSIFPSVDAIAEFKVMGANYPAEFGRSQGSVLNVIFKSGTNRLHGSAYEFLRNSALDSNDFFANQKGVPLGSFKRSQFGGTVSGPIRHDKTFFMVSYEGLRARTYDSTNTTVPTDLQRQGDFSKTFAANGQTIAVFNPFTTRDASKAFQVEFSGRMANSASGTEDTYDSPRGTLQTNAGKVSGDGGLIERYAKLAGRSADILPDKQLFEGPAKKPGRQSSGEEELRADATTSAHMKNWMECVRSRKPPVADIHAGYGHSIALSMAITALHTGKKVLFDEKSQDIVTT